MGSSSFQKALKAKTVKELVGESRNILTLSPEHTVKEAFVKLKEAHVRSAPLKVDGQWQLVDYFDFVWYLVDSLRIASATSETTIKCLLETTAIIEPFLKTPLAKVANYSKRNKFVVANPSTPVLEIANSLAEGAKKALVIQDDKVVNVVSATDIIGILKEHVTAKPGTQTQTIMQMEELGLGTKRAVTVNEHVSMIEALILMRENGYSALPILTEDGDVSSVVSVRDLHFAEQQGNFGLLNEPVFDFIKMSRQSSASPKTMFPFIWCKKDSSIEMVVKRLAATQVHRLVVVDDSRNPIGVISVIDVIAGLMKQAN